MTLEELVPRDAGRMDVQGMTAGIEFDDALVHGQADSYSTCNIITIVCCANTVCTGGTYAV
ncbi:hypothetical protein [Streptomyces sp. URMC 123]|uniref:hypothetical protein n=1 Tax=Streptomyces sp. URMC 123 TaxID=3423403 RepID=UPI003F1C6798